MCEASRSLGHWQISYPRSVVDSRYREDVRTFASAFYRRHSLKNPVKLHEVEVLRFISPTWRTNSYTTGWKVVILKIYHGEQLDT